MRRLLPLCAVLVVLLCAAAGMVGVAEARRGGGGRGYRNTYLGSGVRARGNHTRSSASGCPRGLSGGTWTACVGSSLLAAAAVLL
ncbi:hypothetical protein C2845_PM08G28140 [Panicum miliaceum]|uniref:Uncharacterized protein n=1 Tax=Panicum miliaceum TaxID=4540 RepID=A0A3L6R0B2_PANMI|nr:hypothetical protein C2845_PM08G28140 [Panicum miliaceum]